MRVLEYDYCAPPANTRDFPVVLRQQFKMLVRSCVPRLEGRRSMRCRPARTGHHRTRLTVGRLVGVQARRHTSTRKVVVAPPNSSLSLLKVINLPKATCSNYALRFPQASRRRPSSCSPQSPAGTSTAQHLSNPRLDEDDSSLESAGSGGAGANPRAETSMNSCTDVMAGPRVFWSRQFRT